MNFALSKSQSPVPSFRRFCVWSCFSAILGGDLSHFSSFSSRLCFKSDPLSCINIVALTSGHELCPMCMNSHFDLSRDPPIGSSRKHQCNYKRILFNLTLNLAPNASSLRVKSVNLPPSSFRAAMWVMDCCILYCSINSEASLSNLILISPFRRELEKIQLGICLNICLETANKIHMIGCFHSQNGTTKISG
jgi:hypothetical protein